MSLASSLKRARIVLVGSGRMGQIRSSLMYANPKLEMIGVCDVNAEGAKSLASEYSAESFTSVHQAIEYFGVRNADYNYGALQQQQTLAAGGGGPPSISAIVEDDEGISPIDGIVLCSPTFTHEEVIREVAEYGLPIFTEKPVDETATKIEKLFDICEDNGAKLCCGFQRRFDETYVSAAQAVREGKIGTPVSANIFFADHPCPPIEFLLTGGDIFMDLSAHDVDYIRWVLDDEVASVYATGSSSLPELKAAGVHDNSTMVMKFRKGTVVTLTMSRSATYGYDQRAEIFGTEGLASVGNQLENNSIISTAQGILQSKLKHSFPERFNQAFYSELDAFANTILFDMEWPISRQDCIAVQRIADAAKKSSETNMVVEL